MKRSELKKQIEEIITELLDENVAYELTGAVGKTTQSFPSDAEAQKFKAQNSNIKSIKKI
jgi:hypothetical protein